MTRLRWMSLAVALATMLAGMATAGEKALTIEDVFGDTPIAGRLPRSLTWLPGGRDFSTLVTTGQGKERKVELWLENAESGERRLLLGHDDLAALGAGEGPRRAWRGSYTWFPTGDTLLITSRGDLFVVALAGKKVTRLTETEAAEEQPQLSPDGRWVAYVRDNDLWAMAIDGRREVRLSSDGGPNRVNGKLDWVYDEELGGRGQTPGFAWSPDSRAVLFLTLDESDVPRFPLVDLLPVHPEITWQHYPKAGDANPVPGLRVVQVPREGDGDTTTMSLAVGGDETPYIPRFGWLPDGSAFWYQRLDRAQTRLELNVVSWPSGAARTLLVEEDEAWVNLHDDLHFFADGRFLWSSERDGHRHLYLHAADGSLLARLTSGAWEVVAVEEVDEGDGVVLFTANREHVTRRDLYRVALDGSGLTRITRDAGTHSASVAPGGDWIVDRFSSRAEPDRMTVLDASGTPLRDVPYIVEPTVADYTVAAVDLIEIPGGDGVPLQASVMKPPSFDPRHRYPVLIYVYGGPHAQVVRDAWGGRNRLFHAYLASRGVVVFSVDNRGSFGRGREFERAILGHLGRVELEDQVRGVRWLTAQSWVDPERIAIWGWSYGGMMTCYALANAPELFTAGVAVAPVTDWHYYDSIYTERYMKLPADNEDGYRDASPVYQADKIKGFLTLVHGTGDDNVHWQSTAAMVDRLYKAGVGYDLQLYPNLTHGLYGRGSYTHLYRRIADTLLRFLRPATSEAGAPTAEP